MESVQALHAELNYSEYEPALQSLTGLWRTLQAQRSKAERDPRQLKQYRSLLERSIHRLRDGESLPAEEAAQAKVEFEQWFEAAKRQHRIHEREALRLPSDFVGWLAKWYPEVASKFTQAQAATERQPSRDNFKRLKEAAEQAIAAFVDF